MNSNTKRDVSIDVARGIALLLMVIGHLGIKKWPIQFIYTFHMPLFFVLSGLTISRSEQFGKYLVKRVKRLMVPYVLLAAIYALPGVKNWALVLYGSRNALAEASSLTPLWFLPALFTADTVFQIVLQISGGGNHYKQVMLSVLFGTLGCILARLRFIPIGLPFGLESALIAMPFVAVGYIVKGNYQSLRTRYKIMGSVALLCIPLLLFQFNLPVSVTAGFDHVEMSIGSCGNYALFYINAFAGSFGIILAAGLLRKSFFLQKLGRCTLACLGTHGLIISGLYTVANRIGVPFWASGIAAFMLVLLLTFPLQKAAEVFFPNLVGK